MHCSCWSLPRMWQFCKYTCNHRQKAKQKMIATLSSYRLRTSVVLLVLTMFLVSHHNYFTGVHTEVEPSTTTLVASSKLANSIFKNMFDFKYHKMIIWREVGDLCGTASNAFWKSKSIANICCNLWSIAYKIFLVTVTSWNSAEQSCRNKSVINAQ